MNLLPENEVTEFENRTYVNPQLVVDEGESFIDKLRSTQQANNQQIKTQTYNLGKAVPSNLGGLVGGEGYWTSRYQTPQTNSLFNDLRASNRATALNQAMQNDIAAWKKRYEDAKRKYELSQTGGGGDNPDPVEGGYDKKDVTADSVWAEGGVATSAKNANNISKLNKASGGATEFVTIRESGEVYTYESDGKGHTRVSNTTDPSYKKADDGYFYVANNKNEANQKAFDAWIKDFPNLLRQNQNNGVFNW